MSGVEVAGLVLGSLPLLISALEHYADGISTIKLWRRYKREWANLALQLDVEAARFRVTCEKLLDGLVTAKLLSDLIDDPGSELWDDHALETRLKGRLQDSYWPYLRSVKAMDAAVKELLSKLEYDESGKPLRGDYNTFKEEYKRIKFSLSRKEYENSLLQIKNSNDMLANLTNQNMELEPSRQKRKRSGQHFKTVQKQAKNLYDTLLSSWKCDCEGHCVSLGLESRTENIISANEDSIRFRVVFSYEAKGPVDAKWAWQEAEFRILDKHCATDRAPLSPGNFSSDSIVSLDRIATKSSNGSTVGKRLSIRSMPKKEVKFRPDISPIFRKATSDSSPILRSRGSSSSSVIQAKDPDATPILRIHGVDSSSTLQSQTSNMSSPHPYTETLEDLMLIESLCKIMQGGHRAVNSISKEKCLGYLVQQEDTQQRLGLYLANTDSQPQAQPDVTSLGNLLSEQPNQLSVASLTPSKPPMNWGERLGLALTLASSVLQLYMTPWLQEYWDKNDIFINEACKKNIRQHSFVRRKFLTGSDEQTKKTPHLPNVIQNKSIFALGIVLIELSLGQSLTSMRLPEDLDSNGQPTSWTDLTTATRLLEAVYGQAGTRYGDAVRRCIRCEFDHRNTSLDDDAFRQAVYDGVVAPLEDDFRVFFQT